MFYGIDPRRNIIKKVVDNKIHPCKGFVHDSTISPTHKGKERKKKQKNKRKIERTKERKAD